MTTAAARWPWRAWLACSLAGVVLIALPDSDRRVFSISEAHGAALTDLVGAVVLVAGWAILDVQVWRGRRRLGAVGRSGLVLLSGAVLAGGVLVGWSVAGDAGWWWLAGAAVLAAVQLVAAALAAPRDRARSTVST